MGIYDRDYMQAPKQSQTEYVGSGATKKTGSNLSFWQKARFNLWLLLHPKKKTGKVPKVVIDTNAMIAARFKESGTSHRLLELCIAGKVCALISEPIKAENQHIVGKVKPPANFLALLEQFYTKAKVITNLPDLRVSEDSSDDKFIACAVAGNADYVISSDRHLLELDGYQGIKVCNAAEFLREQNF